MILETLKKSTIFSVLPDKDLKKIASLFEEIHFENNDYIFMEDDPSDWLYLVSRGRVKVLKHTMSGKDIILEVKAPGELFCCAAVLDNKPFPESAQAMRAVSAIKISRKNLLEIIDRYPSLQSGIAKYSSAQLREAHEMLKNVASERVEKRIAFLLLKLSEKGKDEEGFKKIDFSLTRQEIADMVGTSVETCIRTMSKFQKDGLIKTSDHLIMVKRESLQQFLDIY